MDPDLPWRLDPGAHEHRRPDDRMEPGDVLADDVEVGRPPFRESLWIVREAGARDVVDQRVEPDVDHACLGVPRAVLPLRRLAVLGERKRDAPMEGFAADRDVVEALAQEREHLILAVLGLDPVRVRLEMREQPVPVGRQPEEPVPLGQPLELDVRVVRAAHPVRRLVQVGRRLEALVRAVPALVLAEVDVTVRIRAADHLLRGAAVVGIGRPDEPIGRDEELVLRVGEQLDHAIDERLRVLAELLRALRDVDRVLVRTGQEARVIALHPVPARDDVGPDHLVQGVEPGLVVRIRDGGRQVVAGTFGHEVLDREGESSRPGAVVGDEGTRRGTRESRRRPIGRRVLGQPRRRIDRPGIAIELRGLVTGGSCGRSAGRVKRAA